MNTSSQKTTKVAYILLYFPRLTETFVAEEIEALRLHHIEVKIISLFSSRHHPGPIQPLSQKLLQYTWYSPAPWTRALWKANIHFLYDSPKLYLYLLYTLLTQPYSKRSFFVPLKRLVVFLKAVSVAHHLESSGVEVLHSHFAAFSAAASWICARLLGLPFTVTVHAYDIFSVKNDLLRLISQEAAHIVAISNYNRDYVTQLATCPLAHVSVIHCGVNVSDIRGTAQMPVKYPSDNVLRVISVGSLVAKKDHRTLINACRLLKNRGLRFSCNIIGSGPDGPALTRLVHEHGLEQHVHLLGARSHPEILGAYAQHNVFVLACKIAPDGNRDGIPVVLMEAAEKQLPLISTPVSGIPELVRDEDTGILVPPEDPVALANALVRLAADPSLRVRLGQNAQSLVRAEFNIGRSALQLASLFRATCHNCGSKYVAMPTQAISH